MAKKVIEQGKALLVSKTFWFNVLAAVVFVANYFGFGSFQPDARVAEFIGLVTTLGNVYLRTKTSQAITKLK